jgi:hypothetical protein
MTVCKASGCQLAATGHGHYCEAHKRALRRHGDALMKGVTVMELSTYRKRVVLRMKTNAANPAWHMMEANWAAMADYSRACLARIDAGEAFNRWTARAHREVVKLANNVETTDLISMVSAVYLLREENPHRFPTDAAFNVQLVRRCRGMTDVNVGVGWNHKTQKASRAYRDMPPRANQLLGATLNAVFGAAGLTVARLETSYRVKQEDQKVQLNEALGELV